MSNLVPTTANSTGRQASRTGGMYRFVSRTYDLAAPRPARTASNFSPLNTVTFIKSSGPDFNNQVIVTSICEVNSEGNDDYQKCSYYLSALTALFPNLYETAKTLLLDYGYQAEEINEAGLQALGVSLAERIPLPKLMVIMGQAILILYKNINDQIQSYTQFMRSSGTALSASTGHYLSTGAYDELAIGFETARMLSFRLRAHQTLRADLLRNLIAHRHLPGSVGGMCNYVCGIVEWCEMSGLEVIFVALCTTKSPILKDLSLKPEVRCLYEAYKIINSTEHPPYFRIFYPEVASQVLVRSKWPILLAVAQKVRASLNGTDSQHDPVPEHLAQTVQTLFDRHQEFARTSRAADTGV